MPEKMSLRMVFRCGPARKAGEAGAAESERAYGFDAAKLTKLETKRSSK
jgi:hypothetical protein